MNNNKISNPKTPTPTGLIMNDKDYITTFLTCLKELSKNYTTASSEVSNESLFNSYNSVYQQIINLQREVYELMFRKGWYSLEIAESTKIEEKYNTLLQEYLDLEIE